MLNTLAMILEKRGSEYVDKFLSGDVTITEKLDTYRILFEKVDGELKFFKKDNTELNLIERVLTNIWEDAIVELSIILNEKEIPEGFSFGVAYTPVNKPIRLEYTQIPKYILTDVTERDPKTKKVVESFSHHEVLEWSSLLSLGRPPVLFEGKLSETMKEHLTHYGSGNFEEGDKLTGIFENGSYSNADIIEGIIIKNEDQIMQIQSYEFKLLNETYEKAESSRDFYDLTLLRINSFMDQYNFPVLEKETPEESYLELVCNIFNNYCKLGNISEDVDPKYLNPPSYGYSGDLNLLLLNNKETIGVLEKGNKIHESVFKIMLSSFRKYKRPYGLLSESDVQKFNTYVYFINEKTDANDLGLAPSLEPQILNEANSKNIVVNAVEDKIRTDVDNMRIISSIQKAFTPKAPKVIKGKTKCAIYLTNPQPLTTAQKENIESISKMFQVPVVLGFVEGTGRVEGNKFHLSDQIKRAQVESFADNNRKICPSFFSVESWDIVEIFQYARPKYEPVVIITDKEKKSELSLQLYFEEEVMGGRLGVEPDFNIGEMDNRDKLTAFRAIEDNLFYTFQYITPQPVWGFFDMMVSEYKEWNGSVPDQFKKNKY